MHKYNLRTGRGLVERNKGKNIEGLKRYSTICLSFPRLSWGSGRSFYNSRSWCNRLENPRPRLCAAPLLMCSTCVIFGQQNRIGRGFPPFAITQSRQDLSGRGHNVCSGSLRIALKKDQSANVSTRSSEGFSHASDNAPSHPASSKPNPLLTATATATTNTLSTSTDTWHHEQSNDSLEIHVPTTGNHKS